MNIITNVEPDLKPFGYAPGNYLITCIDVEHDKTGCSLPFAARGSVRCYRCAMQRYEANEVRKAEEAEVGRKVRAPQLTRDNCVPRHADETCRTVDKALTVALLVAKLHSEAEEIALDLTNPEEYGDLYTTLMALAELNGVTHDQIIEAAYDKNEAKGDLLKGNFWVPKEFIND